jgi:hypothetical protein
MGAIPAGNEGVEEVYAYLLSEYLPARYPTMFGISKDGKTFLNHVSGAKWPLKPPKTPLDAFKILGETIEDDLLLLRETDEGHRVIAFVTCYPAGFDPSEKLGLLLKDVHTPVPSYDKIGLSMERFFSKLEVGKNVKRVNVSGRHQT